MLRDETICAIKVDTMAADALAPCAARTSATMILNMQDKRVFVVHEQGFPVAHQYCEIIENAITFIPS